MGTSLDHVVDSTNFFAGDFEAIYPVFQEVRKEIFGGNLPASASIGVSKLLDPRFHVEVKLTASLPDSWLRGVGPPDTPTNDPNLGRPAVKGRLQVNS